MEKELKGLSEFEDLVHFKLYRACEDALRHKLNSPHVSAFVVELVPNLELLFHDIIHRTYHPRPGIAFVVKEPVKREVFAAQIRDRIIHHFIFNEVAPWWIKRFSYDSYSCIEQRGNLFGIQRCVKQLRKASHNYTETVWIYKGDISSFFMSLPRQKLYERALWGLEHQFKRKDPMFDLLKYLWYEIIFDEPTIGVEKRGDLSLWKELPPEKSLFHQPLGRGIVIGNLSSQLLSNIYLDLLDRFIKIELGYQFYGRYVDDFYIIVRESEREKLLKDIPRIENQLIKMGLTINRRKTNFQIADKGLPFLGTVIYPGRVIPGRRIRKSTQRALIEYTAGVASEETLISYLGLLIHYNSKKILGKIFDKAGQDYNF
ncbi:hypothetical protein IJH10_01635 [Candidatus Saccharibacteria bacterium]|nr:hypothetical protein [Candidatus Saccharibacteria bacterium]